MTDKKIFQLRNSSSKCRFNKIIITHRDVISEISFFFEFIESINVIVYRHGNNILNDEQ